MENSPVIICNPSYGNGPYLRSTEIALAVNKLLPSQAKIIVPLVYGETQKRIMEEEFGNRKEIIFDDAYGEILYKIFYKNQTFESFLTQWIASVDNVSNEVKQYLQSTYSHITLEIARAPLVCTGISPSYCTLFARFSDIWERAIGIPEINIADSVLLEAARKMRILEKTYSLRFICDPGTFTGEITEDIEIPLTATPHISPNDMQKGIYASVSGISGLDQLQQESGILTIYSNNTDIIPNSIYASPHNIGHKNIIAHVARAGWGAIWESLLSDTPLIVTPYAPDDDPEIYFNNKKIEELGLGIIRSNNPISVDLEKIKCLNESLSKYRKILIKRYGTLNGAEYSAKKIVEHWMNENE